MIYHRKHDDGRRFAFTATNVQRFLRSIPVIVVALLGRCDVKYHQRNFGCNAFSFVTQTLHESTLPFVSSSTKSKSYRSSCEMKKRAVLPQPRNTLSSRNYGVYRKSVARDDDITNDPNHSLQSGTDSRKVVMADYMATCVPGMAHILADELKLLGGQHIELSGTSAVYFRVEYHQPTIILNILLWCRTAHKIMELLCRTKEPIYTRNDIYEWIRNTIPTTDLLLNPNANVNGKQTWFTLSVAVTLNNAKYIPSDINHSHYTALNIKNALVDAAREICESDGIHNFEADRPSVDTTESCDVPLMVMVRGMPSSGSYTTPYNGKNNYNDRPQYDSRNNNNSYDTADAQPPSGGAHISLFRCIHGIGSLHRRGYRSNMQIHKAAIKESTAAALLYAAQWHIKCQHENGAVLMDPMMGSGTLLVEGAMMAADIAPGLMRIKCGIPSSQSPPILRWKVDTDNDDTSSTKSEPIQTIWNRLLMDATKRAQRGIESLRERNIHIIGNDMSDRAYELAKASVQHAGLRNVVQLDCTDCAHWKPNIIPTVATSSMSKSDNCLPWMIVSNPPWGVRLTEDMDISWEALRTFLRSDVSVVPKTNSDDTNQSEVWILSGNAEATKHLGLRRSQSIPLQTGEQNLRWLQYILRPPGTMNHTKSDDDYKRKLAPDIIRRSNEYPFDNQSDGATVQRVPFDRRGESRNSEQQNRVNDRSTTNQFRDRTYQANGSNRMTLSSGSGRRQESYPSPTEQRKQGRPERPPRQRKEKKSAPATSAENDWLI